ncbi:hypothetical protein RJT34_14425 [Clitoria ternatea]|uniref:Uncharacterized protein n=1 Tax=Clitoria ternatea TaxID=43366 RepID=A0AAN9JQS8_CLITE
MHSSFVIYKMYGSGVLKAYTRQEYGQEAEPKHRHAQVWRRDIGLLEMDNARTQEQTERQRAHAGARRGHKLVDVPTRKQGGAGQAPGTCVYVHQSKDETNTRHQCGYAGAA